MTNSSKKSAKTSRDNLDLDLDARLDHATSTLSLDEEPPVGDELDRVLAKAKKQLDADIPPLVTDDDVIDFDNLDSLLDVLDIEDINENDKAEPAPLKYSLATLESQLTAAMEPTDESDEDLDNLLGGAGFDFDSLLGDASDELTPDEEAILHEDSLLATVDELLNFGAFGDDIEPDLEQNVVDNDDVVEFDISLDDLDDVVIEPELTAIDEPETIENLVPELTAIDEPETIENLAPELVAVDEPKILENLAPELVAVDEPEILENLVPELVAIDEPETIENLVPELTAVDEPETIENLAPELTAVDEPETIENLVPELTAVDEPEILENLAPELTTVDEAELKQEDVESLAESVDFEEVEIAVEDDVTDLTDIEKVELTVEPEAALEDLIDSVPFENSLKIDTDQSEIDSKIDDIFTEEFNDFDDVADIAATLVEISISDESFDDDLDGFKQLDGLNDAMENKNDTTAAAAGFNLLDDDTVEKEHATPVANLAEDLDWMKQLDDLDTDADKTTKPVSLEKAPEEPADDLDWMKQLDDLDTDADKTTEPVSLEKAPEEPADDLDWMKQLDDLDTDADKTTEPVSLEKAPEESADDLDWMKQLEDLDTDADKTTEPVSLEKTPEESADDLDWMKQLEGMDEHDEDTAKMLMDAGHDKDTDDDTVVNRNFNIADEEPKTASFSSAVDEDALIAKAAEIAVSQLKDDQQHVLSQLRADQDGIETRTKKQLADAENKRKKTAVFGYAALGVGIIGLIGSAGIGWLSYGTKNETTTLTESVTALDEKLTAVEIKNTEKEKEIASIKTSVDSLNQKVEKIAAAQIAAPVVAAAPIDATKLPSKITSPVDLLNSKTSAPAVASVKTDVTSPVIDAPKVAESDVVQPPVNPADDTTERKTIESKLSDMAKKTTDDAKVKAVAKAKAESDKATAKAEAELLTKKLAKITAVAKAASATSKTEEQRKLLADNQASRFSGQKSRGAARGAVSRDQQKMINTAKIESLKSKVSSNKAAAKKEVLNVAVKPKKATSAGKYSVNVVSYQQEWFAQSKAAEFKQKGIPVEVVPVDASNHGTRFRLKVAGFKNKNEASAYAKSHGINDAWVGSND